MEKRVLLAVVLSFAVLYGYQALFPPPKPQPKAPAAVTTTPEAAAPAPAPAPPAPVEAQTPSAAGAPLLGDTADRDVVVENDAVRAVFSTRGAVLRSWSLKKYKAANGQPLEIFPSNAGPNPAKPFSLSVPDAAVTRSLKEALFKPSATEVNVTAPATLTFEYEDAAGLSARKEFSFSPEHPYVVNFSATIKQGGTELVPTVELGPGIGSGVIESSRTYNPPAQPIFYRGGSVSRIKAAKVAENSVQEGAIGFAGVDDHYFLAATLPAEQPIHLEYRALEVPTGTATPAHFIDWSVRFPTAPRNARFFLGPKNFDVLASVDRDLVRSIDFGIFAWLVVPLLRALKWVNTYVGNYGWSIILLTVLINVVMFPLRHKSVVSMRRMQEIQPEVKAIQDRYANLKMTDPGRQKMNTELMNLYRERGVNPASGCVPMLLTVPVLFAFYSMLSVAIELRGAPFVGWIHDLSVHDPLFITPVLMGITQFVQTRMTPSTADPMQQKVMMFMPLIFMTMFLWAPSGLVLYWTVSNLWAIGQQALTNRLIGPAKQRVTGAPSERRVKSVGGGKSQQASKEQK